MTRGTLPTISVGMPVYNGERYLRESISAILAQTFTDFELIISDNASTDGSAAICAAFAEQDPRIRFIRQDNNRGASANFRCVLDAARAPFFVWAGADDMRSPDFLAVNLDILHRRSDVVASGCPARFEGGPPDSDRMGDAAIDDAEPAQRVCRFLGAWHANARYYSLFRREALLGNQTLRGKEYLGSDWAVMLEVLLHGKFARADSGELVLGRHGMSSAGKLFCYYHRGPLDFVAPMWTLFRFTERLSRSFPARQRRQLRGRVMALNLAAFRYRFYLAVTKPLRAFFRRSSAYEAARS